MSIKSKSRLHYLVAALLFCISLSICVYPYFYMHQTSPDKIEISFSLFQQTPDLQQIIEDNQQKAHHSVPAIPSLNILGPPKCGTRTFVNMLSKYDNVVQFGWERGFFNGPNVWRCYPRLNATAWIKYINDYDAGIQTLSNIVKIIQSHPKNKICTVKKYISHWNNKFNLTKRFKKNFTGYENMNCIHPKYALKQYSPSLVDNISFTSNLDKYCYLIEKGPSQSRVPWVPIVYANLLPKTKLITILRNPVYHVTSAYVALSGKGHANANTVLARKHKIIENIDEKESFAVLNGICKRMNTKWNELNNDGIVGIKRYLQLKKTVYKEFIVTYLQRKFVEPKDIAAMPRREIYIWGPFTFPVFLIALFSYDEVLNNKIWNQWTEINAYRVVQFEWLFSDIERSMKIIKCWMMDLNDVECNKHISDKENKKIFATKVEKRNHIGNAANVHEYNAWFNDNIHRIYNPCYQAMKNILFYDRPKLLLGEWNSWNYTYIDDD